MVSHSLNVNVYNGDGKREGFTDTVTVKLGCEGEIIASRVSSTVNIANLSLLCRQT